MMDGVRLTGVQTAPEPKVGLETSVKPEPATGQFMIKLPLLIVEVSETFVVRRTFGPTSCAAAKSDGSMAPA